MIMKTGEFNLSILTESAPFQIFKQFGFQSGRNADKFSGTYAGQRTANNIQYIPEHANGVISAKVISTSDCDSHTLFIADVTGASILSDEPSVTYQYYFKHIKPQPELSREQKKGFVCKICAYVYEGEKLPDDYICPLCKHGASDFRPV
jgi:flavin reductase (DIM6/NTAB) family NADH-FMN oxidoreductase RutF